MQFNLQHSSAVFCLCWLCHAVLCVQQQWRAGLHFTTEQGMPCLCSSWSPRLGRLMDA